MKTKLMLILLFVTCWLCLSSTVLNFPLSVQEHDQWCWAGATQSIFHYYNLPVTQNEIAWYGTEGSNTWNYLWGYDVLPTRNGINLILDHFAGLQSVFGETVNALTMSQVATEIDSLQPFVTRIGWSDGGGHFIDCYGYDHNNLYLMDPWPGNGYTIADYDWYVNGAPDFIWTHSLLLNSGVGLRAYFQATPPNGYGPLDVSFTEYSLGNPTGWAWDFNNDGVTDSNLQNPEWTFTFHAQYPVSLTVTKSGRTHTYTVNNCITVDDNPPQIINPIPDLSFSMDTTCYTINVNDVFLDADNDVLTLSFHNAPGHINGSIQNGLLSLIPVQGWTGTTACFLQCTDDYFHIVNDVFMVTVYDSTANEDNYNLIPKPLFSVFPNPCMTATNIKISNPSLESLTLKVYNSKGQKLTDWIIDAKSEKNIVWNGLDNEGRTIASGVYYLKLDSQSFHQSRKILILK